MSFASLVFTPLVKKLQERYGSPATVRAHGELRRLAGSLHPLRARVPGPARQFLLGDDGVDGMAVRPASRWSQGFSSR